MSSAKLYYENFNQANQGSCLYMEWLLILKSINRSKFIFYMAYFSTQPDFPKTIRPDQYQKRSDPSATARNNWQCKDTLCYFLIPI